MVKAVGRPVWEPTDEEREKIKHFVAIGYTLKQIAQLIGKSEDSLQRHCRDELDHGMLEVNGKVARRLFDKCMAGDTASLIFWTKTRLGWREVSDVNITVPVQFVVEKTPRSGKK